MCWNSPRSSSPLTTLTCIFVRTCFSGDHHIDFSPATDATRGAASASPTCSMRSVAAPRLTMSLFVVGVEHHDLAVVAPEKSEKPDDDAMNHFLSTFRYCARAHEPAAPRHDMS